MDRRNFNRILALSGAGGALYIRPSRALPSVFAESQAPQAAAGTRVLAPVQFDAVCYRVNGKPTFLYSGEFHYFRVPKADWRRRMGLFQAAGGNCLATYIPWCLHEPEEGKFAFSSEDGGLDSEVFLHTAREAGLHVLRRRPTQAGGDACRDSLRRGAPITGHRETRRIHAETNSH